MSPSTARAYEPGAIPVWTFADKVRKAREQAGMKQEEFAKAVSLTSSTLAAYEKGRTQPRFGDVTALARRIQMLTGIPFEWFLVTDEPSPVGPAGLEPTTSTVELRRLAPVTPLRTRAALDLISA